MCSTHPKLEACIIRTIKEYIGRMIRGLHIDTKEDYIRMGNGSQKGNSKAKLGLRYTRHDRIWIEKMGMVLHYGLSR